MEHTNLPSNLQNTHIVLFGFKHVGKSIIGQQLAIPLQRNFFDTDAITEQLFEKKFDKKLTCREIMQNFGTDFFSQLEQQALVQLLQTPPAIIALGGGTPLSEENQKLLKPHVLIHVLAPADVVFERIRQSGLPAFFAKDQDPRSSFQQLWQQRQAVYQHLAHITIHNDGSIQHAVAQILNHLQASNAPTQLNQQILLMHGPNLNKLGQRSKEHYGRCTLADIEQLCRVEAKKFGFDLKTYQSNHEGALIDTLQNISVHCVGIIINPGALAHYSYALHDALVDTRLPIVEVHLSAITEREAWRKISVTSRACIQTISGQKEAGYVAAIQLLATQLRMDQ